MDFTKNLSYQVDILCSVLENAEYECAMREAALLETGMYDSYSVRIIHEAFADKVKTFFESLPGMINNAMQKFIELFNVKYQKAKTYIDKYSEYIDKKVKLETVSIYEYNVANIRDTELPNINFEQMQESFDDLSAAQKKLFPNFATDDPTAFVDNIKNKLRGEPKTNEKPSESGSEFDIDSAKKYLLDFPQVKKNIENDKKKLLSALNVFKAIMKTKQNEESVNNVGEKNEAFYSVMFDKTLLLEAEDSSDNSGDDNKSTNNSSSSPESEKDKSADNILKSAASKVKDGASDMVITLKRIKNAVNVCTKFFSARMSIANECFDEYFRVIKEHVESYNDQAKEGSENTSTEGNENTEEKTEDKKDDMTPEETEKVKEVVKSAMNSDGSVKNMDDTGKAKLFDRLKSAVGGKENAITGIFSKLTSKMKKG